MRRMNLKKSFGEKKKKRERLGEEKVQQRINNKQQLPGVEGSLSLL